MLDSVTIILFCQTENFSGKKNFVLKESDPMVLVFWQ